MRGVRTFIGCAEPVLSSASSPVVFGLCLASQ